MVSPAPSRLDTLIAAAIETAPARVRPLADANGQIYWLKTVERHKGVRRLQKGDARRAFRAELTALDRLGALGVPVPPVIARGHDYFVVADVGPTLDMLLRDRSVDPSERVRAFTTAGDALARLHEAGYAHGRPALRDICYSDGKIAFIDLERFKDRKSGNMMRALDVLLFIHTWFMRRTEPGPELNAAIGAYRAGADHAIWRAVRRWAVAMTPVAFVAALLGRFRPRSKDLHAPIRVVRWVRAQD